MSLSLPRRPGLSLAGVRLVLRPPLRVCRVASVLPGPTCRRPYPGGTTGEGQSFPEEPVTAAFPLPLRGRLPPFPFRSLLSVRAGYGLLACGITQGSFPSEASAVRLPRLPLRLLPPGTTGARQELHLLKNDALARRTKGAGVILCGCRRSLSALSQRQGGGKASGGQEPFSNRLRDRDRLSLQEKNRPVSLFYSSSDHHQP